MVRAVIPRDPDAPLDMLVVPSGLSGMRALWNVALEAQDHTVVDQAIRLLNRTHEVLSIPRSFSHIIHTATCESALVYGLNDSMVSKIHSLVAYRLFALVLATFDDGGQELAPALRDRVGEIREDYIRTCMAYVRVGTATGGPRQVVLSL